MFYKSKSHDESTLVRLRGGRVISNNYVVEDQGTLSFAKPIGYLPEDNPVRDRMALVAFLTFVSLLYIYSFLVYIQEIPSIKLSNEGPGLIDRILSPTFSHFFIYLMFIPLIRFAIKKLTSDGPKYYFDFKNKEFWKGKLNRQAAAVYDFSEIYCFSIENTLEETPMIKGGFSRVTSILRQYEEVEVFYVLMVLKNGESKKIMSTLSRKNALEEVKKLSDKTQIKLLVDKSFYQ